MSDRQRRDLLALLEDWGELVIRPGTIEDDGPDGAVVTTWRAARDEARMAYRAWRQSHGREAYAVYRAAADREDAAQAVLAGAVRCRASERVGGRPESPRRSPRRRRRGTSRRRPGAPSP
ncbi:MAG: hypothetical protein ACRDPC_16275 [Solirubrobacteraceae bacterium]